LYWLRLISRICSSFTLWR